MSSRPCVGCAWRPSPALMTATPGFTCRAMRCGAPDCEWRTTNMSASIACRFQTVSSSVSPLLVDEAPTLRLITSADRRLAAISKVVRVRVEFSKNTLKIVLPRSSGTFFTSRSPTETNWSAVSRMCRINSAESPSVVSRCLRRPSAPTCRFDRVIGLIWAASPRRSRSFPVVVGEHQVLVGADLDPRAEEVGGDRQLAAAAIGEDRQAHGARAGRSRRARSAPRGWCARCAARRPPARSRARRPGTGSGCGAIRDAIRCVRSRRDAASPRAGPAARRACSRRFNRSATHAPPV